MKSKLDVPAVQMQIEANASCDPALFWDSICGKCTFAEYHRGEARKAWDDLHKNGFDTRKPEWSHFNLVYEANLIAYCQALHSIADIAAHMIYFAVFGASALKERDINFRNVKGKLEESVSRKSLVLKQMEAISKLKLYDSVDAFVNTIKHRRLLPPPSYQVLIDHGTCIRRGMQINQFEYNGKTIPDLRSEELFEYYDLLSAEVKKLYEVLPKRLPSMAEGGGV